MASELAMNQRKAAAIDSLIEALTAASAITGETLELPEMHTPRAAANPMKQVLLIEGICGAATKALSDLGRMYLGVSAELEALKESSTALSAELEALKAAKPKGKKAKTEASGEQNGDQGPETGDEEAAQ